MLHYGTYLQLRRYLGSAVLFAMLGGGTLSARAQEFEEPAPSVQDGTEQDRIVEGRPKLHSVKRYLHPLTWVDFTFKPILRFAESQSSRLSTEEEPEKISGVKFGLDRTGSSSGFGPKIKPYHRNLFGTGVEVEVPLIYTYKRYESYHVVGRVPLAGDPDFRRVSLEVTAGYRSRAADNFFGIGNDTDEKSRTRFRSTIREVAGAFNVRLNEAWSSSVEVRKRSVGVTNPTGERSAQEVFRHSPVPGLDTGARLLSTAIAVERNTADGVVPSRGGAHRLEAGIHEGGGPGDFSYWKYRYVGEHFFSLTDDGRKVIAVRGLVETNQEKGGSEVPFFDLPYVGGRSSVRGLESFRFMDKSAISVGAEYRYRIWRHFDVGLFVDQGQVAPEIGDFDLGSFHTGYGARLVVRPSSKYAISIDAGKSAERWKLYIDITSGF